MYKTIITPRMGETDGLRHINNNNIPLWFETARNPIFKIFVPDLELTYKKWNLIMVHAEYNYLKQIYYGHDVEIRTYISKIGNSSFTVFQEAWQNGQLRDNGSTVIVYFDFIKQESKTIPNEIRKQLEQHFITREELEKNNKKEMNENKNKY
ncbi:thioesterase family protein [Methanosphaera sp. WGK6]|uniref:acyl-CoA thioesterase n=1 Tax=Methanosphaera sp. WGK6 TaxID=1561964 RepID=UPI00084BF44A|nr:thioesterase family protein [Methanosphaera sp. WGK6]OED30723.1 thioesterase [Methanosphaera sp. WGK6]